VGVDNPVGGTHMENVLGLAGMWPQVENMGLVLKEECKEEELERIGKELE